MNKKVLILCTGNSCRSIIAEALINARLEGIDAQSAGVKAAGSVNPNAKKVLEANGIWKERYYSKVVEEVLEEKFDLIVTVCNHAQEHCPVFPKLTSKLHIGFDDPDGKAYVAFEKTYEEIEAVLLHEIKKIL